MMKIGKIRIIILGILGIVAFGTYIYSNYTIKINKTDLNSEIYGIIDDALPMEIDGVICINSKYNTKKTSSHGQKLCNFINDNYLNYSIYYYNAEVNGKISSQSIINGLNDLNDNGIKKINISLSSKIYSDDIQNWIKEHKDIKVYASYNNKINSYDYPAMYEGVIASGEFNEIIKFKDIDVQYKSKNIIGIAPFKVYSGNSFLSLMSMLENK